MTKNYIKQFTKFDSITNFRLINRFIVTVGLFLLIPITIDIKGEYLTPAVISILLISETLSVKAHRYLVNRFSISDIYKLGMGVHTLLVFITCMYFGDKLTFIVMFSIFTIIEIAVFGAFSIKLDTYQTMNYPSDVQEFKVTRNSVSADATLIGLSLSALLSLVSIDLAVLVVIVYQILFSIYFLYRWNYIRDIVSFEHNNVY